MSTALLVEYFNDLPEPHGEHPKAWENKLRAGLRRFRARVQNRYNEGTLLRLLSSGDCLARRSAVLALGMIGDMSTCNSPVASMLHDSDPNVRHLATDALWSLWFRGDSEANNQELQRVLNMRDKKKKRAALDALIAKAPEFAEAHNQRAILHFQAEEWQKSIADCDRVLKLNPYHFGAAAGMGRSCMELRKHKAALKAFRLALRIHPGLEDVDEAIRSLEAALGEEGTRDERKES